MRKLFLIPLILGLATFVCLGKSTSALSGSDWQAGRIMDDGVFFATNTISATDIQVFLNSKVPNCDTNGTQSYAGTTRAAYGTSRGYPPPYTCLRNYSQDTPTKAGEPGLCNQYNGGVKSAAQIIYDVGQACTINPKVLVVLLEKEQSLVTDDWPWSIQYRSATGYGCPDTAPCDSEYYGFFNQVYNAARQFKRYGRDATIFSYRANRDNYIQYNPNAGCGGTNVFLHTQASASLYNYTPYQPNAAALGNLYGTGDGCSAYGNRNFWRLFIDWFGSPYTNTPYAWLYEGQSAYSDAGRTQSFTSEVTASPGSTIYMEVKARNMGYQTWTQGTINLGASRPQDRSSAFSNGTWLNPARPTRLLESSVAPGGIGTFRFSMTAPASSGTYYEYFNVLAEGVAWMNDPGQHFRINVVSPISPNNSTNTGLPAGGILRAKEYLLSPDSQSTLALQTDGNLVLSGSLESVWSTATAGQAPGLLVMQNDGNLVLYNASNQPVWHTGTYGNPGAHLELQIDGNLVLYSQAGTPLWATSTIHNPNHLAYVITGINPGRILYAGQSIDTADRRYKMVLQKDGNLVIYSPNRAIWSLGSVGSGAHYVAMQTDGNLVLYNSNNQPLWHTGTNGRGLSYIVMQSDGNLVIYNGIGIATWNSATAGRL